MVVAGGVVADVVGGVVAVVVILNCNKNMTTSHCWRYRERLRKENLQRNSHFEVQEEVLEADFKEELRGVYGFNRMDLR